MVNYLGEFKLIGIFKGFTCTKYELYILKIIKI